MYICRHKRKSMIIKPCAKINLGLNIVGKRDDGYHDLETVFYPVAIYDEIEIVETNGEPNTCILTIEGQPIKGEASKNLVVKAYRALAGQRTLPAVGIRLKKEIPMEAGMGGGSSDCAYTLRLLNNMFSLGMKEDELIETASRLGADCPFFILSEPAYAEGVGERLQPVRLDLSEYYFLIVKPPVSVSTREAFAQIKVCKPEKCCKDIVSQPIETWKEELKNDFEHSIFPQYPVIGEIKQKLYGLGAIYAAMSGSGSAVYGIFRERPEHAEHLFEGCYTSVTKAARPEFVIE